MDLETMTMDLIVGSGEAKSKAMEAISLAREGEFAEAKTAAKEAHHLLVGAHEIQNALVREEIEHGVPLTLLLGHAQDHLMSAILIIDLAEEFIQIYETIKGGK